MTMLRYRCGTLPNAINRRLSIELEQQRVTGSRTMSKHPCPPPSVPPPSSRPATRTPVSDVGRSNVFFFASRPSASMPSPRALSLSQSLRWVHRTPWVPRKPPTPSDTPVRLRNATPPNFFERLGLRPRRAPTPRTTSLSGVNRR